MELHAEKLDLEAAEDTSRHTIQMHVEKLWRLGLRI
jgi:hypothetical protein